MGDLKLVDVRSYFNNDVLVLFLWIVLLMPALCQLQLASGASASGGKTLENPARANLSVCNMQQCECTHPVHRSWLMVNCSFDNTQKIELKPGSIPPDAQVVFLFGGREILFASQVFTPVKDLQKVTIHGTQNLQLKRHSFVNLTTTKLLLEIIECAAVIIETSAFQAIKGPLSGSMTRSSSVVLQKNAFSYLLDMTINDVSDLELAEGAFSFNYADIGRHGAETIIKFKNVLIAELPKSTFASSAAEIRIEDSTIRVIRKNAFSANTIFKVILSNLSLHRIESEAFSEQTMVQQLKIFDCRIQILESTAILSAISNFTLHHSRVTSIKSSAINSTSASVSITNSTFDHIDPNGLVFREWNDMTIDWNTFRNLSPNALVLPFTYYPELHAEFRFTSNEAYTVWPLGLKFVSDLVYKSENYFLSAHVENMYFSELCRCDIEKWLSDIFGSDDFLDRYIETSYCTLNSVLAPCFNAMEGLIGMRNFSEQVCGTGPIKCEVMNEKTKSMVETINKNLPFGEENRESYWILVAVLSVVFMACILVAVIYGVYSVVRCLKQKGFCLQLSEFEYSGNDDIGTTEAEDIMVTVENKLNENLPDELTPELLQALREKLEDPETYNEAREMIERLYDHFLVEENEEVEREEAHLYEELSAARPPPPTVTTEFPSAEKATRPFSFLRLIEERLNLPPSDLSEGHDGNDSRTILMGEYAEPMDMERPQAHTEVHIYSELPEARNSKMALRPLPDKPRRDAGEGTSIMAQEFR